MLQIKTLTQLDQADLHRIMCGYTSTEIYVVSKEESPERTTISLELVTLDQPYVKQWTDDDGGEYAACFEYELSLGVYDGELLVGLALAEAREWNKSLWIWQFGVDADYKRRGIGRRLMDELAHRATKAGLRIMVAETQNTNVPAIRFYRAAGFEIDAIDLSYYPNHDVTDFEVAVFMKRRLTG
jgi:ribosomal protein S18 acetylase RimI-like enzyme